MLDFKLGTRIEIEYWDEETGKKAGGPYACQLVDIIDDLNITVSVPIHGARLVIIPTKSIVRCLIIDSNNKPFSFGGRVEKLHMNGNVAAMNIRITGDMVNTQRRDYFRLKCFLEGSYYLLEDYVKKGDLEETGQELKKVFTRDISGSGLCLIADEPITKGSRIKINLVLDCQNELSLVCKAVRCDIYNDITPKKYEWGLTFIDISKKDQDTLIKFIFNKQSILLRTTKI